MYVNASDTEMNIDVSSVRRPNFYFGRTIEQNGAQHSFKGFLDEVRLWNTALTQEEIISSVSSVNLEDESLVAYWTFDDAPGDSLFDLSGNGNNGDIIG